MENKIDAYRLGVGLVIINDNNKVFMGERLDSPNNFQMPQGGIDEGEQTIDALFRELYEETGINKDKIEIISEFNDWLYYDFPENLIGRLFGGKYKGQKQKWFLLRFSGNDNDIDLSAHNIQEFSTYKWVDFEDVPDNAVDFKKDMYIEVINNFKKFI